LDTNFITEEIRAVIGCSTDRVQAHHVVEASEVRRFIHATMDRSPRYWDEHSSQAARYGGAVAPLAFPTHAFRDAPDAPDILDAAGKPDFDGLSREFRGLPAIKVPLPRLLNGGFEYEFFRFARVGDKIFCRSSYKDIQQKDSKSGPMVLVLIEDEYSLESGEILLRVVNTVILR
jgi:N-terminal half of MaoC dehydratase